MSNISVIGLNIKKIRTRQGISKYQLSKLAGVGSATISQIESGARQTLKGDTINKIADALHVSVNDLLREGDKLHLESDNACEILSMMCNSGFIKLDGVLLDRQECILLETAIGLSINGIRMRRHEIQRHELEKEYVKSQLKVIK